ncbi:MAG TPA: nitronate monooxygenase, partial [Gemmatimonadaceae bacterium]|nr:nitronate monooxygenase [Gemmatimonadaceae bacterium]
MLTTRFTQLVGCSVPIQQAAIGSLSNPLLAAAVSNAGGLGMLAAYGGTPDEIANELKKIRALTTAPFGANFIMNFMDPAEVVECV